MTSRQGLGVGGGTVKSTELAYSRFLSSPF